MAAGAALALLFGANALATSLSPANPQVNRETLDYGLKPRQIAQDTWVIEGAVEDFTPDNGCNIINTGFIATNEGVIVINTGPSRLYGEQQRKAIEKVSGGAPILHVLNLNLHPDYFFGNQAWKNREVEALPGTIAGQTAEGEAYADNLYRMCGDWMKGTESTPASHALQAGEVRLGGHDIKLVRLEGHTADDLVLLDETTGVLFAGGLVFMDRVPTTPHARFDAWQRSLATMGNWVDESRVKTVVPSHGPVHAGAKGIEQTSAWLSWITKTMRDSAASGFDLSELLHQPVPTRFESWAAQPAELHRSLTQWYPQFEKAALVPNQ
ncbi:quinoprotein relay system zinc metallohydrolase 1 [Hydrogenophaga sp. 5NK40-0174]|uniref:quinoprotein relay system zinc metallohydrolase 1 n=1 Tax=Hydrogenophaga sp. 5NK40-0174 TaxID=3127649 RepID=UPI003341D2BA